MGKFLEQLIKNKTIHLDFLHNKVGRFLVRYFEWSLIPLFLYGIFVFGYLITRSQAETSGIIIRFYIENIEQYSIGRNYGIRTHKNDALILVLNDSSRYVVISRNKQGVLLERNLKGEKVNLKYHLEFESMPRKLFDFEIRKSGFKDFDETDGTFASVNSIRFTDGKEVKVQKINIYILLAFVAFGVWNLLIALNYLKMIWDKSPETKTGINHIQEKRTVKMERFIFEKCPACGMRLEKNAEECPDCGLYLI